MGEFFSAHRVALTRLGGAIVLVFGLFQLGVFRSFTLSRERRLPFRLDQLAMNPLTALAMGFTFSFSWTPCVGPALTSVLLMVSSAASRGEGILLIGVYTLGFVLPFLAVGWFTSALLSFFKKHQRVVRFTAKAGGILLIIVGVMMLTEYTGQGGNLGGATSEIPRGGKSQNGGPGFHLGGPVWEYPHLVRVPGQDGDPQFLGDLVPLLRPRDAGLEGNLSRLWFQ